MIRGMETIYDVFRLLLNASRNMLSDATIAEAHKIIDKADPAVDTPPEEAKAGA